MRQGRGRPKAIEQKKRIIAQTAAVLFSEKSYLDTSLADIAVAAGFTKAGIYHYFPSKDEILFYVTNTFLDEGLEEIEQQLSGVKDSRAKIRTLVHHVISHYTREQSAAKTLFHDNMLLPSQSFQIIKEKQRRYVQITVDILGEFFGQKLSKGHMISLAFLLLGMCSWTFSWYKPQGSVTPDELSEIIYDIFIEGIQGHIQKIDN